MTDSPAADAAGTSSQAADANANAADVPVAGSGAPRRVVVAPDKFKGTLTAAQVAAHLTDGLTRAAPGVIVRAVPVADGGDGTVDAAVVAGYRRVALTVQGPTGAPTPAALAVRGDVAIVESAQACGLVRLPGGRPAPLTATSYGVGELVAAAVDAGAGQVVLGLGGVATTDGGAGMVHALGGRLLDATGRELPQGGAELSAVDRVDLTGIRDLSGVDVLVACDVDNPLLGPDGAAAIYGPQKGATPHDVAVLDRALARWADVVEGTVPGRAPSPAPRDLPGAGAAGGLGFAALAFLGARMRPGIELLLDLLLFPQAVRGAHLVITGEGSLDEQTLRGKAPAGVANATAALAPGTPVVAVAGRCLLPQARLRRAGIAAAYTLTDVEPDLSRCHARPGPLLQVLAARIVADWLPSTEITAVRRD